LVEGLHEERHMRPVDIPTSLSKELSHSVDASLYVLHAFVHVNVVKFKLLILGNILPLFPLHFILLFLEIWSLAEPL
jgi:hypothetical protein